LSKTTDVASIRKISERIKALTARAEYDEEAGRYWVDAADLRELQELVAPYFSETSPEPEGKPGHDFGDSGNCAGCGMTQSYYEGAMNVLKGWPEDSERKERMAELRACKQDLRGRPRQQR
jgi:hypothetical protein